LRPESQEICFVGDDRYADFIRKYSPEALKPGKITDTAGRVLGEHRGIAYYTIGQRRRLGIQSLKPRYVVSIKRDSHTVVVGSREEASKKSLIVRDLNWLSIEKLTEPREVHVKIRSTMKEVPALISPAGNSRVSVIFDLPQWAPASGQSAVFYDGETVIGGGVIE
jgi:tRNA-specific 2-thiouridylase